jgi:hypothetical protein
MLREIRGGEKLTLSFPFLGGNLLLHQVSLSCFFFPIKKAVMVKLIDLQGFRLRLVGHSLGAAIASLLAIMLRKKSPKELGFSPDIVTAVGYASPPCVSKELAESCSDFVINVVMKVG